MQVKKIILLFVTIATAGSLTVARGQAVSAAHERHVPYSVGLGMSNFDLDYGNDKGVERRMNGITAWAKMDLPGATALLRGFGMEAEGRDVNYMRPSTLPRMRQSTILVGTNYTWPYSRRFRPYAKYLWGLGSISFPSKNQKYTHDTRAVLAPGFGLECRAFGALMVRADYEYQFWGHMFGPHSLNPNGFTLGTVYDFGYRNRNRY